MSDLEKALIRSVGFFVRVVLIAFAVATILGA